MDSVDESLIGLLARSANGDSVALRTLYEQTSPQLFAVLLRILRRSELAEEALQDVYVNIWRNAAAYHAQRGRPMAWMISIARYRALDIRRSLKHEHLNQEVTEMEELLPADNVDVLTQTDLSNDARRLAECMKGLSTDQERCIRLAFLDGLSHDEISRKLSSPMGTVKSWVRRGLMALKACLSS
ncbi:sigma-70 family RNA polymerase sigma factor [Steroidobacter sp.]|uniref:sigma-70 family RNA polymerase sigma factor n=1 Tax=Steroidobacter sp. TaxID=1978227 RepID=UPI001A62B6B9|nr:sigma-70 family RNA polymerase sigma factor [Steroidobacter sp.]MBL8268557.1 sigma-70 family RNA polymerase sigma factor [Steroidobacter sp.]